MAKMQQTEGYISIEMYDIACLISLKLQLAIQMWIFMFSPKEWKLLNNNHLPLH